MRPISKRWTDEEKGRLKALAAKGVSIARIAAALNRTIDSIKVQALKLGIRFPSVREQRKKIAPASTNPWRPYR